MKHFSPAPALVGFKSRPSRVVSDYSLKFLLLPALVAFSAVGRAEIPDQIAVRAIYGEACGESYAGKLALAGALRNRGHVGGVYGLRSPQLAKIEPRAWAACVRAWSESRTNDTSRGATHWGSAADLKAAKFYRRLTPMAKIGGHTFFK